MLADLDPDLNTAPEPVKPNTSSDPIKIESGTCASARKYVTAIIAALVQIATVCLWSIIFNEQAIIFISFKNEIKYLICTCIYSRMQLGNLEYQNERDKRHLG